jgi:hypothetical protein
VNLINVANERRVLQLSLMRPENYVFDNEPYLGYFEENLMCKIGTFMQLVMFAKSEEGIVDDIRGLFTLAACFRYLDPAISAVNNSMVENLLKKIPSDFEYPNTHLKLSDKFEEAFEIIENEDIELIGIRG